MKRDIRIYPDSPCLFDAAAELMTTALEGALHAKPSVSFVLTGGTTPRPLYERLAHPPFKQRIDWGRIHFFWGDERCVAPDDPGSNFGMVLESLLGKVPVPESHIHRMRGELTDHSGAAILYEEEIRQTLPEIPIPKFDLVLLGMGEDGHTASLFPGTVWDEERFVVPNFVPKLHAWRLTMTPRLLNAAHALVFLVAGAGKAEALAGVLEGPTKVYPVQQIAPCEGTVTWMVDGPAASRLRRGNLDAP